MRLINADKLEKTAILGLQLHHVKSRYYYFYEEETIDNAPTVEAIPIEWLDMFMQRYKIQGDNNYKLLHFIVTEWKKWEKENEI